MMTSNQKVISMPRTIKGTLAPNELTRNRSGRANFSPSIENTEKIPFAKPSADDLHTFPPHNSEDNQELSVSDHGNKSSRGYYTRKTSEQWSLLLLRNII